jgi:hypothetical protein
MKKKKCMVFNFTKKKQFSTRSNLNGKVVENVKEIKLLGTIITSDLKWNKNTKFLIKRDYARMELLQKINHIHKVHKR